jgi:hypothetical protein
LTEYTIKNGSGETIKLNIIVTRSPFNPNGQALQIDPRASDTAAFCNVLNSKNGPNPDGFGLKEIRRVFQQACFLTLSALEGVNREAEQRRAEALRCIYRDFYSSDVFTLLYRRQ